MKKYKLYLITALCMICINAWAQEFRSSYFMQTNNMKHQMNPALLDKPYFTLPLLAPINIGGTGNLGYKTFVYQLDNNPNYTQTTFLHPEVSSSEFLGKLKKHNRLDAYINWNLFSVAFKGFHGMNLIEMNMRTNSHLSIPKEVFAFIKEAGAKDVYHFQDVGARAQSFIEIALGHSHRINEKLTVGAKVKTLVGAAYLDMDVKHADVTLDNLSHQWRINADTRFKLALLKSDLKHDGAEENDPVTGRPHVDGIDDVSFGLPGLGFAFDVGAVYRLNDDWTFSAAVTDLGVIRWKDTNIASSNGEYTFDGFEDIYASGNNHNNKLGRQFEDEWDKLSDMFSVYDDGKEECSQRLTTAINIGVQYSLPVYRQLSFGFLYSGRLDGIYSYHQAMLSANVFPTKWFEATLNAAVGSTGWTTGAALSLKARHCNFFIGTDRFFGKVSKQFIPLNNTNYNITMGMSFPL